MKRANIVLGRPYMLSLGRKGAVRVVAVEKKESGDFVVDRNGIRAFSFGARRLSPVPVFDANGNHIASEVAA